MCLLPRSQLGLHEKLSQFAQRLPNRPGYPNFSLQQDGKKNCNVTVAGHHILLCFSFAMAYEYGELPQPDRTHKFNSKHFFRRGFLQSF